jgi:hypothetical protein
MQRFSIRSIKLHLVLLAVLVSLLLPVVGQVAHAANGSDRAKTTPSYDWSDDAVRPAEYDWSDD